MVTTTSAYSSPRYRALPGEGYDGVVRVSSSGLYGTGVLLYDGQAVLTAAHVLINSTAPANVHFETPGGTQTLTARHVEIMPFYDRENGNHDLALVWLSTSPPPDAERYTLYRNSDEIGKPFSLVGYGQPGTGSEGVLTSWEGPPTRLQATNRFDAEAGTLKALLGAIIAWTPQPHSQLIADFDDGSQMHDALGRLIYRPDTGLGADEGFIAPGDSGGPAFIEGKLAGIASYSASLSNGSSHPDNDDIFNSSFGEIAAWQRASYYQQWIDQGLRARYPDAPTRREEVIKTVPEGDDGMSLAYFLLEFTGLRTDPNQWVSVDYSTRDGTATAGEDYIAASGTLILYPGENQAAIPVEIVGDYLPEREEYFYLDVFNPIGGSFGLGVIKLTATRAIIDDDGWWG